MATTHSGDQPVAIERPKRRHGIILAALIVGLVVLGPYIAPIAIAAALTTFRSRRGLKITALVIAALGLLEILGSFSIVG
jgi:hypothetical protein